MIVTCIDDGNWIDSDPEDSIVKAILMVGDDHLLPKKGNKYEVIGHGIIDGIDCYELAEIDTLKYGYAKKLLFNKTRFVIYDDTFIPNAVTDPLGNHSGLCRKLNFYLSLNINHDNSRGNN